MRVLDGAGAASAWAEAAEFEVRPCERDGFAGRWIGADENRLADPLPPLGAWIVPPDAVRGSHHGDDRIWLRGTFGLAAGYPRCFGMARVAAEAGCRVELNGQLLEHDGPFSPDRAVAVRLPWDKLLKGRNTLAVTGTATALGDGVACLARVHAAGTGLVDVVSDGSWRCVDGDQETPVAVLQDPPAAPRPADNGPRRAVEMKRTFGLAEVPQAARLYVTGLGCYEVHLNGRRVCTTPSMMSVNSCGRVTTR